MTDSFPTTPRASRVVRLFAIAIGVAGVALATRTTISSSQWVGRPFPGFVVLDNRVIASVGLGHWSESRIAGLYQSEVVAVDGEAITTTAQLYDRVRARAPGSPFRYRVRREGVDQEVTISSQRFEVRDWLLLFGAFLLSGSVALASGLVAWVLRPRAPMSRALLALGGAISLFLLTAQDLYGPATFFRLHIIGEALVPAAGLQLGLLLPQPDRYSRWRFVSYALALGILIPYEIYLYDPTIYSRVLFADMVHTGAVGILFAVRIMLGYVQRESLLARQRVRVITLGTIFGFGLPAVIVFVSAVTGGSTPMNFAAFTPFLFALSLAYAVVKHDLFEIDAMVKRGAYYLLLTATVGAAYFAAVSVVTLVVPGWATQSAAFPVFFTLVVLVLLDPLRTRLQTVVDRVFFRTTYNAPQLLGHASEVLAATLRRELIVDIVRECVVSAIPNGGTRVLVRTGSDGELREVGGNASAPRALLPHLATHRILTTFDPPEQYPDTVIQQMVRDALVRLQAEIAVPLFARGTLTGMLTAGPKTSGLFYTAGDAEFLQALAHQTAIALENARTYEAVVELNARLEERVRERTAQLEGANRELAEAYAELKSAETHLVHSEKMASLGRLVAGVAHEINNPVSFISTSVAPLRRRLGHAATLAPPKSRRALAEAEDIAGVMARGAERTAAIVKDLRTFSRLGESSRKEVDLHEGIEVTLRLLEPRWRGRITIHREYGALAPVECDPGQLNQAFMNVLANACDAITGSGNVWITTRAEGAGVAVVIRDDGPGIPPDVIGRIFDPFFTTKDVGTGTGLGLAISHSVIRAHGGQIDVESTPGAGTTFRITLPAASPGAAAAVGTG
jgi:signal transduction histidine kinase